MIVAYCTQIHQTAVIHINRLIYILPIAFKLVCWELKWWVALTSPHFCNSVWSPHTAFSNIYSATMNKASMCYCWWINWNYYWCSGLYTDVYRCCFVGALLKAALVCAKAVDYPSDVPLKYQLQNKYGGGMEMEAWSHLPHGSGSNSNSQLSLHSGLCSTQYSEVPAQKTMS